MLRQPEELWPRRSAAPSTASRLAAALARYPKPESSRLHPQDLTLLEAASLIALLRVSALDHVHWTVAPLANSGQRFEPTNKFIGTLFGLLQKGVLAIDASTPVDVVTVEDDMPLAIVISYFRKYEYRRFPVLNARNEAVGILTARSINARLLAELFRELARIENQYVMPPAESASCYFKTFRVARSDFENAGKAATEIKNTLQARGIDPKIIRRVAIAAYELEMNLVVHSDGGTLTFRADEGEIQIIAKDQGPGIADVDLAMQEGWTTANEWVKSLGFGAGMGLPNAKRVADEFHIASEPGRGTTVTIRDVLPPRPPQNPPA